MYRNLLLFFFLSCTGTVRAQIPTQEVQAFNSVYQKTYLETAQSDFPKALRIADSLYQASESPLLKAKSLMLSATLYQQSGDLRKAVDFALKSKAFIADTEDYFWSSKILGFLATQYRSLKLYNKSQEYAAKALAEAKLIPDAERRHCNLALILQEQAYYEADLHKFKSAISLLEKADRHFLQVTANRNHFLATNEQLLGKNYFNLNDIPKARLHYQKALAYIKNTPENYLTGLIYSGLAEVSLNENDPESAGQLLKKAQKIADESQYLELKNEVYRISEAYYARIRNVSALEEVRLKKDTVSAKIAGEASAFLNESYTKLEQKKDTAEKQIRTKDYIIGGISLLLTVGVGLFLIYRERHRRLLKKFRNLMEDPEHNGVAENRLSLSAPMDFPATELKALKLQVDERTGLMTPETEERLLHLLEAFEKSGDYTRNNISLTYLASEFGTNTKYLSHIINTYRKKDFKNYINELRVRYIINKLKKEPVYRQYKIAVLAEEAGFSSQAKFSTIFKNETSFSPSLFIRYLTDEEEKSVSWNER